MQFCVGFFVSDDTPTPNTKGNTMPSNTRILPSRDVVNTTPKGIRLTHAERDIAEATANTHDTDMGLPDNMIRLWGFTSLAIS